MTENPSPTAKLTVQMFESIGQTAIGLDPPASEITLDRFAWLSRLLDLLPSDMIGPRLPNVSAEVAGSFQLSVRIQSPPSDEQFPAFDPYEAQNRLRLVLVGMTEETHGMVWDHWWADVANQVLWRLGIKQHAFCFWTTDDNEAPFLCVYAEDHPIYHPVTGQAFVDQLHRYLTEQAMMMIDTKRHFAGAIERAFGIRPLIQSAGRAHTVSVRTSPQTVHGHLGWLELRLTIAPRGPEDTMYIFPILALRSNHTRAGELPCSQQRRIKVDPTLPPQEGVEMALYGVLANIRELMGLMSGLWAIMGQSPVWELDMHSVLSNIYDRIPTTAEGPQHV